MSLSSLLTAPPPSKLTKKSVTNISSADKLAKRPSKAAAALIKQFTLSRKKKKTLRRKGSSFTEGDSRTTHASKTRERKESMLSFRTAHDSRENRFFSRTLRKKKKGKESERLEDNLQKLTFRIVSADDSNNIPLPKQRMKDFANFSTDTDLHSLSDDEDGKERHLGKLVPDMPPVFFVSEQSLYNEKDFVIAWDEDDVEEQSKSSKKKTIEIDISSYSSDKTCTHDI